MKKELCELKISKSNFKNLNNILTKRYGMVIFLGKNKDVVSFKKSIIKEGFNDGMVVQIYNNEDDRVIGSGKRRYAFAMDVNDERYVENFNKGLSIGLRLDTELFVLGNTIKKAEQVRKVEMAINSGHMVFINLEEKNARDALDKLIELGFDEDLINKKDFVSGFVNVNKRNTLLLSFYIKIIKFSNMLKERLKQKKSGVFQL